MKTSPTVSCISNTVASYLLIFFFFFNDPATTQIYTLSLHDALPICHLPRQPGAGGTAERIPLLQGQLVSPGAGPRGTGRRVVDRRYVPLRDRASALDSAGARSEEHTSNSSH